LEHFHGTHFIASGFKNLKITGINSLFKKLIFKFYGKRFLTFAQAWQALYSLVNLFIQVGPIIN
jgi:hypothetical protein